MLEFESLNVHSLSAALTNLLPLLSNKSFHDLSSNLRKLALLKQSFRRKIFTLFFLKIKKLVPRLLYHDLNVNTEGPLAELRQF